MQFLRPMKFKLSEFLNIMLIFLVTKNLNTIVTESFLRIEKLNIYLVFIKQSYFAVLKKNSTLNSIHYVAMKMLNKRELQQIPINCLSGFIFKKSINNSKNVLQNHVLSW